MATAKTVCNILLHAKTTVHDIWLLPRLSAISCFLPRLLYTMHDYCQDCLQYLASCQDYCTPCTTTAKTVCNILLPAKTTVHDAWLLPRLSAISCFLPRLLYTMHDYCQDCLQYLTSCQDYCTLCMATAKTVCNILLPAKTIVHYAWLLPRLSALSCFMPRLLYMIHGYCQDCLQYLASCPDNCI